MYVSLPVLQTGFGLIDKTVVMAKAAYDPMLAAFARSKWFRVFQFHQHALRMITCG
jgi:hypothetical protein